MQIRFVIIAAWYKNVLVCYRSKMHSRILLASGGQANGTHFKISLIVVAVRRTESYYYELLSLLCVGAFNKHILSCTSNDTYFYDLMASVFERK